MSQVQGTTVTFDAKYPMQKMSGRLDYFERYFKYMVMFYQYRGIAMAAAVIAFRFMGSQPILAIIAGAVAAYFWSYKDFPEYMYHKNSRVITLVN